MILKLCFLLVIGGTFLLIPDVSSQGNDDLYILIDRVEVLKCREDPGIIEIHERDISILDQNGDKVNYIKAPGTYKIHFSRVSLNQPLPYVSGEISALLKIPLFEAPGGLANFIRFDLPYPVIPEKRLFTEKCDRESGVIRKQEPNRREPRAYCRYCQLCQTAGRTEDGLLRHKYLPDVEKPGSTERSFKRVCNQLNPTTYEFLRTVQLPSKTTLKQEADRRYKSKLGQELRRRFDKGKGQFEVKMNLVYTRNPPRPFPQCGRGLFSFIPGSTDQCMSKYAQDCVSGEQLAACYTTVFNYRFTDRYSELQQFLASKGIIHKLRDIYSPSEIRYTLTT